MVGVEQPEITAVKFSYGLTLSNGNYGSERVEVSYWANVRPEQDVEELECDLAGRAREFVEGRLKASRSEAVRQALETPEERRARLEAVNRAWEAERRHDAYVTDREAEEHAAQEYGGEHDPRPEDLP